MSAVFRAARGGLGGRRLQAIIIGLVVLAATAASTLALGMLADAHSPFDHAFATQHGADVAVTVDTSAASRRPARRPRLSVKRRHRRRRAVPDRERHRAGRPAGGQRHDRRPAHLRRPFLARRPGRRPRPAAGPLAGKRQPGRALGERERARPARLHAHRRQAGADRRRHRELGHQHRRRLGAARRDDRHRRRAAAHQPGTAALPVRVQRDRRATSPRTSARSRPRCRRTRSSARSPTSPSASPSSPAWRRGCRSSSRSA